MRAAVHAEWTKLRTVAGPAWLLLGAVALTVALSALAAGSVTCPACGVDEAKTSLTGVQLGQAVVAVLAVLLIGEEYGSGLIHTSLAAVPRRLVLLGAKAVVLTVPVLVAGAVAVAGSLLASELTIPYDAGSTWRAAGGSVLYLVLVALLSLGLATAVRDSAAAVGLVLGLLYLFPVLAAVVGNPHWRRHLQQIGPSSAGLAVQATRGLRDLPIGPWAGLGVLGLWAVGALLLGGVLLTARDA